MLYLDFVQNREDFILENEKKFPRMMQKILYFYRKTTAKPIKYEIDGKKVVLISKFNKRVARKLDKIFQIDVTNSVCVCEQLRENKEFIDYLNERKINIFDGKWLFKFLVCDIAEYICNKLELLPETQEISVLVNNPDFLAFENLKKLSQKFKNINVVTKNLRRFEKIENEIYENNGLILNITNNFKKACTNSKIVFNFDFEDKDFGKIRVLGDSIIVNLENKLEVKQSNFKGEIIDFYIINLPLKYKIVYKKLNNFNSSILYESLIYKNTAIQNILKEIKNDRIEIVCLQSGNQNIFLQK